MVLRFALRTSRSTTSAGVGMVLFVSSVGSTSAEAAGETRDVTAAITLVLKVVAKNPRRSMDGPLESRVPLAEGASPFDYRPAEGAGAFGWAVNESNRASALG